MAAQTLSPEEVAAWAPDEEFLPYSCYPDFTAEACRNYRAAQLRSLASSPAHHPFRVEGDHGSALFGITRLAWDTGQFGMPAGRVDYVLLRPFDPSRRGRLELAVSAAAAAAGACDELGLEHVSARFDSRDLLLIQAMEAAGFQLVDGILKFARSAADFEPPADRPPGVIIRDAAESDIPELAALAARGFVYDRFHNDPLLAEGVADRVHAAWLENAVRGKTGSGVVCAEVDGKPGGFFIVALDTDAERHFGESVGTLVLITVDRAYRRRGVALALSLGAAAWLKERGAGRFEVGTQLANVPAANVYLKAGFRLVQTSVSLRRVA